ncbi:unnamed protein product [Citrullus colocynthis]|uniref:Uncharacterized protein n=1 Tax=Citrullus colocynthis TaxID=252529 RepID=A0ABP0XSR9_9ROSI
MVSNKKHLTILAIVLYLMLFLISTYGAARILNPNGNTKALKIKVIVVGRIVRRDLAHGGNYGPGIQ